MKRHVALMGFMASGKSTIGRKLAARLGCPFFDTDALVARSHGSVGAVFAREGEAAFRNYERAAIADVLSRDELSIVALGGGALTVAANRDLLAERAYGVFIRVSPEQVLARVRKSKEPRPLLGADPTLSQIREIYDQRIPHYEAADYIVEAAHLTSQQVLEQIDRWLHGSGIVGERA